MMIQDQIQIEPLENITQQEWLPLWLDYQTFYQTQLSEEVNQHT
jgi:hypothetical protein